MPVDRTRRLACASACIAALSYLPIAHAANPIGGPFTNPANGYQYELLSESDWISAETAARALGGHLVTIRSEAENDWIYDTFTPLIASVDGSMLWTGLFSYNLGGGAFSAYLWASGEPVGYTNWSPGQPDHARGNEAFAHIWTPQMLQPTVQRQWNDLENDPAEFGIHGFGVVELGAPVFAAPPLPAVPEPAAYVLFAAGLALLGVRARTAC